MRKFVCVRVTSMTGVDLNRWRFDHDLTFSVLLANADGTVYHRYGTRDRESAESRLSLDALRRLLERTLEEHAAHEKAPSPPGPASRYVVEEIPLMAKKLAKKPEKCIHCHTVYDAQREQALADGRWQRDDVWRFPRPEQVGLSFSPEELAVVSSASGAAARAGVRAGDRIVKAKGVPIASEADLQLVLEEAPRGKTEVPLLIERAGATVEARLELPDGWKVGTPLTFSWRPSMWGLRPTPGFGGPTLSPEEAERLGVPRGSFRVTYLVDWGDHPEDGRSARKAGVRKGDVVTGAAGHTFETGQHFQSWFRLTQVPGTTCTIDVLRDGKRLAIELPVLR